MKVKDSVADRNIEKVLGLPAGRFAAAFARGRAPALSKLDRELCLMHGYDPHDFARQLARSNGRISLHSLSGQSVVLPKDGRAPEWIDILPLGVFVGQDGRGPFQADGEEIIAATKAHGLGDGLPIDYDHGTFVDNDSRAAGWIRELKIAGDVLKARVEWTQKGAAAIAAKEYRFVSPVFKFEPNDPDAPKSEQSGRVQYLIGAGLVNDPNLSMTALSAQAR